MRRSNAKLQAAGPPAPKMEPHKPRFRPKYSRCCCCCLRPLPLSITSLSLVFVLIYLFFASKTSEPSRFSIIIDGGSTGTRVHVFSYRIGGGLLPIVDFGMSGSLKVGPGLSFYAEDPESAGESLVKLIEFGKGMVPRERWMETEIRLMATAGLRLVDDGVGERILKSCRKVLRGSGFLFEDDWATVISGMDEGIYAWIAANYALGTLGGSPQKTTGIFELGGASAQVAFVSSESLPPEFSRVLKIGEVEYNLYSHSFLHLGQNVAHESLRELLSTNDQKTSVSLVHEGTLRDPCTHKGYLHHSEPRKLVDGSFDLKTLYNPAVHAAGNFSECRSAALMLLQKGKDKCLYSTCLLGSTFIPKLEGRFIATENFFYTSKFFGLGSASFLSDLILSGEHFCQEDWLKLKKKYPAMEEEDLQRYCFSSAYIVALLHDSLGIPINDRRFQFANKVGDVPLDWALGAFIMQKTPTQRSAEDIGRMTAISYDFLSYLPIFIISIVLIFTAWSMKRWRKPRLKTIYDLEKGRYITTRIVRRKVTFNS